MASISGSVSIKAKVDGQLLSEMERGASALKQQVEGVSKGPARRLLEERETRANGIIDKLRRGEILNSAMDAIQMFSAGGVVSDAASAFGFVNGEADKMVLSAIVNAATFNFGAAVGDIEDAARIGLPKLRADAERLERMGEAPRARSQRCACSQDVPRPTDRYREHRGIPGFARRRGGHIEVDLKVFLGKAEFQAVLKGRLAFPGFTGPFGRDLPKMLALFDARFGDLIGQLPHLNSAEHGRRKAANEASGSEYEKIFNDPSLSFEDKLFLFMVLVAKKQEEKIEKAMKKYDEFQKRQKDKADKEKSMGMVSGIASLGVGAALTAAGIPPPLSMMLGSMITSAVADGINKVEEGVQDAKDEVKDADDTTKLSKEEKGWSEQRWMMELQRLQEQMSKMYQMLSNTMKAMNDTQMTAVRNLR